MKLQTKIFITLTILCTMLIFSFSLQPVDVSADVSSGFGHWLLQTFFPSLSGKLQSLPPEEQDLLHLILRKVAHFTEFSVLGICTVSAGIKITLSYKYVGVIGYCVLVAMIDETIQLFVSGRTGSIVDVLLDSCGALCGIGVVLLIRRFLRGNSYLKHI